MIKALSRQHPEQTFTLRWADEDFGSNVGSVVVKGGEIVEGGDLENGSREAYDLAIELIYGGVLSDDMRREEDGSISYLDEDETDEDGDEDED